MPSRRPSVRIWLAASSIIDKKQKEILAFHEALYWVGRKYYNHNSSYLTRRLIRSLLQKDHFENIYLAVFEFLTNQIPSDISSLNENVPGSSSFYLWRSNVFDLQGKFTKSKGNLSCPSEISIKTNHDATFAFKILIDSNTSEISQKNLTEWPGISSMKDFKDRGIMPQATLDAAELGLDDRAMLFLDKDNNTWFFLGLNRKDEMFYMSFWTRAAGDLCFLKRNVKI